MDRREKAANRPAPTTLEDKGQLGGSSNLLEHPSTPQLEAQERTVQG